MPAPTISNTSGATIEFLYKATTGPSGIVDTNPSTSGSIRNFVSDSMSPQNTSMDITIGGTGAWHLIDYELAYDSTGSTVIAFLYKDGATVSIGGATPTGHNGAGARPSPTWCEPDGVGIDQYQLRHSLLFRIATEGGRIPILAHSNAGPGAFPRA
jgi:hypothetical protein